VKKALVFILSAILILSLLAGCNSDQPKVDQDQNTPPAAEQPKEDQDKKDDQASNEDQTNEESDSEDINTSLTKEGVYSGRIDSHSSEIMIDGEPVAVQIQNVLEVIDQINEGDHVIFTYEENEYGQMVIINIKKN